MRLALVAAVVGLAVMAVACGGSAAPSLTPQTPKAKIGDRLALGSYALTVVQMVDPYKSSNQFMQPKQGTRQVAFEVIIENISNGEQWYDAVNFHLTDMAAYRYGHGFMDRPKPELNYGKLAPGDKVRGWIAFEVRAAAKLDRLDMKGYGDQKPLTFFLTP